MSIVFDGMVNHYRVVVVSYSIKDVNRYLKEAENRLKESMEYLELDPAEDFVPSPMDVAIGMMLSDITRLDCTPFEEPGYGLPEFSIYYNADARSFCGRWGYLGDHQTLDECGLYFALVEEDEAREKITGIIEELSSRYDNLAYAIIDTRYDP